MTITSIDASPWTLPLRAPFRIAARTATEAHNVMVNIATDEGIAGIGAAAPVEYVTGETVESVVRDVRSIEALLIGIEASRLGPAMDAARDALPESPAARAAVEMALLDIWGKHHRISLWQHFGGRFDRLPTDLTVPIVGPEEARAIVEEAAAGGFTHFKIKVGGDDGHESDLARVRAIALAAPNAGLRIDANQAFTPDSCLAFLAEVLKLSHNIELIEQPVPAEDIAGLRHIRERTALPIFADEAAKTPADVCRLIREQAVDGINIKLMKSGIGGALEIMAACQAAGIKMMIGCMLESRLGLTAALHIAAGTGAIPIIDLDSHRLLSPDPLRTGGFHENGPWMTIDETRHGWGVEGCGGDGTNKK